MRDHWAHGHAGLITDCLAAMQQPGLDGRTSFQLHAPLEQGARAHLLRHASPAVHDLALEQLVYTKDYYLRLAEAESGGPGQ